jgi:ABC-type lipoprotein release transport system permease subunit
MNLSSYLSLIKIILHGRSAMNILMATLISFSFSIAVILSTIGLMDGFDHLLKSSLRQTTGDLVLQSKKGFFEFNQELEEAILKSSPMNVAEVIQTEAFALSGESSRGVLVKGIDSQSFERATGLKIQLKIGEVAVGSELSELLGLKIGDKLPITFGRGNLSNESLPGVKLFEISDIIHHGIYQKDLRFVYLMKNDVAEMIGVDQKINQLILNYFDINKPLDNLDSLEKPKEILQRNLDFDFFVRPFWAEYSFLIEAVKIEKFSITMILQIIVIVAVFNILAFIIYIMEKKSQEFFFLRAIGLGQNKLLTTWFFLIILIWVMACLCGVMLTSFFNYLLHNLTLFKIPGEIYVLSALDLRLELFDYAIVYLFSFLWVCLALFISYYRIKKKSILQGLRQEFS